MAATQLVTSRAQGSSEVQHILRGVRRRGQNAQVRRRRLERALRAKSPAIIDELTALGFTADTVALLELIPVLQVAWADDRLPRRARKVIVELAEEMDLPDVAWECLETHLAFRASPSFYRRTLAVLAQMYLLCAKEDAARARQALLRRIHAIGRMGNGVLSAVTGTISCAKRDELWAIESALACGAQKGAHVGEERGEEPLLWDVELQPID